MANQKISDLTAATAFATGDLIEIETAGGQSRKITQDMLTELMRDTLAAALTAGANITITPNDGADTITIAAAGGGGGGGGVVVHPGFASGRWYRPGPYGQTNSALNAGVMYAIPLRIPEGVTISDLAAYVVTGITGANGKLAIYDHNQALHIPGNKLAEVAVTAAASAALAQGTLATPLALTAGRYWIVCQFDQAVTVVTTAATDGVLSHDLGTLNGNPTRLDNTLSYTNSFASGLPASYPTSGYNTSNSGCPLVCFKAA